MAQCDNVMVNCPKCGDMVKLAEHIRIDCRMRGSLCSTRRKVTMLQVRTLLILIGIRVVPLVIVNTRVKMIF